MKTHLFCRPAITGILKSICMLLILAACSDEPEVLPARHNGGTASGDVVTEDAANGRRWNNPNHPNYNLNVLLFSTQKRCFAIGFIKFRQYENETQMIHLDTRVLGLEPNTNYVLQRAVDTVLDGDCTGTSWLTLGKGLDPQPLITNNKGFAEADLFRSVAAIPVGTTFDIHFQIIKESTSEVVLTSDCYQYTVR